MLDQTYTLSDGIDIPRLGLGTWFIDDGDSAEAVRQAAKIGYRHVDTAQAYGNENGVGEGIRTCGVPRAEMFVTSKLAAEIKDRDEAVTAIDESLSTMGLEYLDLMIIHSPQPWEDFGGDDRYVEGNRAAWRALEEAREAGKLRAIGLSNFQAGDVDAIVETCSVRPVVNQVLAHIANTPFELIEHCRGHDMLVEGYSPIAHGELLDKEEVVKMAERYGVSVPQLGIRYVLQLGLVALPKTADPDHMRSNADVDFEISDDDMETLRTMEPMEDYGEAGQFPVFAN